MTQTDKEKIKKAAMFIDSFLVRTNTNLKKCASSKDLPEKESLIEILESQKRVQKDKGIRSKKISRKRARMLNLERQNKLARKSR